MEQYINYATYALIALLVIGFLIGFLRNTKRSLIRTIMIVVSVFVAILLAPVASNAIMGAFVTGMTFSSFGFTINFEEVARKILSDDAANDLLSSGESITKLAQALTKIFVNIIAFIGILVVLLILTLIAYWITSIVMHVKAKKRNEENTASAGARLGYRALGGLLGIVSAIALSVAFLMPVFGVMNICDGFLATSQTQNEETVSAVSFNHTAGKLYYTEDKTIGKVETYIEKYAEIKTTYDNTFAGKFFNITKIGDLGKITFNRLTTAEIDGLKVNVTNELVAMVQLYNQYKENFVVNEFDITNNKCIDALWKMYKTTNQSEIVKSFISEFVPKITGKWIADEKFMGIGNPVPEQYKSIVKEVLEIFNTNYLTEINKNIEVIKNTVKAANNNGFLKSVQDGEDVLEYLAKDKIVVGETERDQTLVKDILVELSKSDKIKDALPNLSNEMFKMVYKMAVYEVGVDELEEKFPTFTDEQIEEINWTSEAEKMQAIVKNVAKVFGEIQSANADDMSLYLNELTNIGKVLDNAKNSDILSSRIKTFMTDFITEKVTLDESVKTQLLNQIDENWSATEFSFETAFAGIQSLANKANDLVSILDSTSTESLTIEDLKDTIKDIVKDENMVSTVKELIGKGDGEESTNIIAEIVGEENAQTVEVITDVLDAFMNIQEKYAEDEEALDAAVEGAINAGQKIIDIVATGSISLGGEEATAEEMQTTANEIVEALESSEVIMDLIKVTTESENSALQDFVDDATTGATAEEMEMIENAIAAIENAENREALAKLFGITL